MRNEGKETLVLANAIDSVITGSSGAPGGCNAVGGHRGAQFQDKMPAHLAQFSSIMEGL